MTEIKIFDAITRPSSQEKSEIVNFLFDNLDQYGDAREHIQKAIDYSLKEFPSFGGCTLVLSEDGLITGAVVVNRTGMGGYIPENILVYIATDKNKRGKGLGKILMKETLEYVKGDIALHVEQNNPARFLYEKYGFTNPYLEMRLKRTK